MRHVWSMESSRYGGLQSELDAPTPALAMRAGIAHRWVVNSMKGKPVTRSAQKLNFNHYDKEYMQDVFPTLSELRHRGTIEWTDALGGFWIATKMEHVRAIALNTDVFSSRYNGIPKDLGLGDAVMPPIQLDPPDHTRMKKLLMPSFTQAGAEALREYTRTTVVGLLDNLLAKGDIFDVAEDFARFVPTAVICKLLDFHDLEKFINWVRRVPEHAADDPADAAAAGAEMFAYIYEVIQERRGGSGDDLISKLLATEVDGEKLDDMEVAFCAILMFLAGIDTTWATINASLLYLAQHPDQQQHLRENPDAIDLAREEFLRAYAPVSPGRLVTTDVNVGGAELKKGDMVLMSYPSANRDEAEFENAGEVVLDRSPNRHLAFGVGVHRCIGVHIARMELDITLREFLKIVPRFTLVAPDRVEWNVGQARRPSNIVIKVHK